MAHKKGAGSTKNGRDSNACRLGNFVFDPVCLKACSFKCEDFLKLAPQDEQAYFLWRDSNLVG
jgi:hypothetical protein